MTDNERESLPETILTDQKVQKALQSAFTAAIQREKAPGGRVLQLVHQLATVVIGAAVSWAALFASDFIKLPDRVDVLTTEIKKVKEEVRLLKVEVGTSERSIAEKLDAMRDRREQIGNELAEIRGRLRR